MSSSPKALLDSYDLFPKKRLGQNFMHDPKALDKIIAAAELRPDDTVVEVGAGTGALTARLAETACQFYGKPRIIGKFSPAVFWPRPNIHSAVMRIETHETHPVDVPTAQAFFRVVKAGFGMKRKQLKNALAAGLHIHASTARGLLTAANIAPQRRAETLTLEEWGQLTRTVSAHLIF